MRAKMKSRVIIFIILMSYLPQAGLAEIKVDYGKEQGGTSAAEIVYRNDPEEVLIPIYLMGAVGKTGLFHVPPRTDLVTLLTLAGGPGLSSNLREVIHRRQMPTVSVSEVDVMAMLTNPELKSPMLKANDVVFIPSKEPIISSDTMLVMGFISGITGLILTGLLLSNLGKK